MAIAVIDTNKQILAPTTPRRARILLREGKAAIYRRFPFTLILKHQVETAIVLPNVQLKLDPGSTQTGVALVNQATGEILFAAEIEHKGERIKDSLRKRRGVRNNRRQRKTRYRKPSFKAKKKWLNRKGHNQKGKKADGGNRLERKTGCANKVHPQGWLPPSLESRVQNGITWSTRLMNIYPVAGISLERVKFDMQLMEQPEISGIEYQQGTLAGYQVREYLLEKYHRKCCYCGKKNIPLQIEHIIPRSRTGTSNCVWNLCLACGPCNQKKGTRTAEEFGFPELHDHARVPLHHAAAVNSTRKRLLERLSELGLPVETGSGALTKYNRSQRGLPKTHWLDAANVGESTPLTLGLPESVLLIKAFGYGHRQVYQMDERGFPSARRTRSKKFRGYQTGEMVEAKIPKGKFKGEEVGRIVIRQRPSFMINKHDVHPKYIRRVQKVDGYGYVTQAISLALAASGGHHPA